MRTPSSGKERPPCLPGGKDISPQLSWSGALDGTKSYSVTVYDPDTPTGSGFWHWAVADIPATITRLSESAGDEHRLTTARGCLPVIQRRPRGHYVGAAPPTGHGPHRYFRVVHALDIPPHAPRPTPYRPSSASPCRSHPRTRRVDRHCRNTRLTAPPDSPETPPPCTSTTFPTPPTSTTARWT
ncbi:YbhB/YbcL family Raf kinase inhibitor-like protein [Streptomyces sp. NPDC090741]|uniref:YbhB/YbcL family Raf kinase inhibitor-like protein n=1 Tax=Streptomyces sp. NPDC090741 TaxID=3365967 RepID=UPI0037F71499